MYSKKAAEHDVKRRIAFIVTDKLQTDWKGGPFSINFSSWEPEMVEEVMEDFRKEGWTVKESNGFYTFS